MASRGRKPAGRGALTREKVLEAALRIVDREGLEELTMRRLGKELGVEAMSLYNHVSDKSALLSGVLELAASRFQAPDVPGRDWRKWVRQWMKNVRKLFRAHPNLFGVILTDVALGPKVLGMIDSLFGRMKEAGLDDKTQMRVWQVLRAYLYGTLAREQIKPAEMSPTAFMACCANLARLMPSLACCDPDAQFEDGLDVILSGLD
ncbi:MAG: TetR/AcrR family transcriptional regulator C-terminal domain-containing protein [Candidatus Coatesbacteria bacterium]